LHLIYKLDAFASRLLSSDDLVFLIRLYATVFNLYVISNNKNVMKTNF